ncbi:hypothetical protein KAT63_01760 [Candidatus Parcubacteria bacterium]|nr:hypothetical protein [Candidatus Parcubacteria bacterium]
MKMIIVCPYCYQHIDTEGKEKPYFERDENFKINGENPKCPKCKLKFEFSKDGVSRIESEIKGFPLNNSCCVESSGY